MYSPCIADYFQLPVLVLLENRHCVPADAALTNPQITKNIAAGAIHDSTVQSQRFSMRPPNFTFAACS